VRDSTDVSSLGKFRLLAVLTQQSENEECFMSHVPYSNAFGSIMCVMVCIRPDVSHVVNVVSLGKVYWQAMKWILSYLRGATDVGSIFDRDNCIGSNVIWYIDSDDAGDLTVA
jgi:hypothetical protein